jgi:transcription antitermination factor NusG
VSYWACARLVPQRERLALHCLGLAGYTTYLPRLCERRISHGRKIEVRPPLFAGYLFLEITNGWWEARWSPGIATLLMSGDTPAVVPMRVIFEIKSREVGGLVELPKPGLKPGARVRVVHGPLQGLPGLFVGMKPRERVEVFLRLFGGEQRVILAKQSVEVVDGL